MGALGAIVEYEDFGVSPECPSRKTLAKFLDHESREEFIGVLEFLGDNAVELEKEKNADTGACGYSYAGECPLVELAFRNVVNVGIE